MGRKHKLGHLCKDASDGAWGFANKQCYQVGDALQLGLNSYKYMARMLYMATAVLSGRPNWKEWQALSDAERDVIIQGNIEKLAKDYRKQAISEGWPEEWEEAAMSFYRIHCIEREHDEQQAADATVNMLKEMKGEG